MSKTNKSDYIRVRVTPDEKFRFQQKAGEAGFDNMSDYARATLFPHTHTLTAVSVAHDQSGPYLRGTATPVESRLAALESTVSSTPEGSQALSAAQQALGLINRKDEDE